MPQQPINPLVDEWLYSSNYSTGNRINYTSILNMFSRWCADRDLDLLDVRARDISEWREQRAASVSPNTLHRNHVALNAFYTWLADDEDGAGEIDRSPMRSMRAPKMVARTEVEIANRADFETFLSNTNSRSYTDRRAQAMMAVMFLAGLRISEATGLATTDVHLDAERPYLHVARSKNGMARDVPITRELTAYLKRWQRVRMGADDGPYFTGTSKCADEYGAISADTWGSWLGRYRTRTGHAVPSAHAWRRGAAVEWLERGMNQTLIEKIMGWRQDGKMIARYTEGAQDRIAADELHRIMEPDGGREERKRDMRQARNRRHRSNLAAV